MPDLNKDDYTEEEQERYDAGYSRLLGLILLSVSPDAAAFRRALNEELAAGFPIDYPNGKGFPLLHRAIYCSVPDRTDMVRDLVEAGADINMKDKDGGTALDCACREYIKYGGPEYLTVINALLAGRQNAGRRDAAGTRNALKESLNAPTRQGRSVAGARLKLDSRWESKDWKNPEQQARRDWLEAYIAACTERRAARNRAGTPAFDYAL